MEVRGAVRVSCLATPLLQYRKVTQSASSCGVSETWRHITSTTTTTTTIIVDITTINTPNFTITTTKIGSMNTYIIINTTTTATITIVNVTTINMLDQNYYHSYHYHPHHRH
ncbi:hypothetical protein E2C01_024163 [Portunus trituberculatus]|uniref:Uncharacterized protein n=1 Tax=Portunus trituberculatus TaxID=210409 RepID=A0A5B7E9U6_PORTR|nr:hypothetical protein [Portunus trituberculatus]